MLGEFSLVLPHFSLVFTIFLALTIQTPSLAQNCFQPKLPKLGISRLVGLDSAAANSPKG